MRIRISFYLSLLFALSFSVPAFSYACMCEDWQECCVDGEWDDDCLSMCPLVIDLDGNGFRFGGDDTAVNFDMLADGQPDLLHWTLADSDDAFLAMDLNGNGVIDNGSELFGHGTKILQTGNLAVNGFVALAQFDLPENGGNDDGIVSEKDRIWPFLLLWTDHDGNGISEQQEVREFAAFHIVSLPTIPKENNRWDSYQNWLRYSAFEVVRLVGHHRSVVEMVDVYFKRVLVSDGNSN